jgi:16S rRNA (guanine527-N7)-methyltransferase
MHTARIAALLEPFLEQSLTQFQLEQISIHIDLLRLWNARINLTAIRKDEEIVTRHFGESLFMARHLFREPETETNAGIRVVDIGSGAGFPGLPLKIWAPKIQLTLIESNHKKAAFLSEVSRTLTLTNIDVITERAEVLARNQSIPRAGIVTLRAVDHFEAILSPAVTLLAPKATLALFVSVAQLDLLEQVGAVRWSAPIPIPESHARVLAIGVLTDKVGNTGD